MQLPMLLFSTLLVFIHACPLVRGQTKILIGNDDGWAVAIIRAQFNALANAGYDVHAHYFCLIACELTGDGHVGHLILPSCQPIWDWISVFAPYHCINPLRI